MKRAISWALVFTLVGMSGLAQAALVPRVSRCETPSILTSTTGRLPSETIPSAYTKGGLLAINDGWMAYTDVTDLSELRLQKQSSKEPPLVDWLYWDLSAIIWDGSAMICLLGGWEFDGNMLEIYKDGTSVFTHTFDEPEDAETYVTRSGGPMLLLHDGTLLILDAYGVLYACKADGSGIRKVVDTAIADFVYYDGMIYFANLDDTAEYKDVYCDTEGEYNDLYYPKLYRMRLDGSGLEKLTDCGVCSLASQGHIILYQNIDEPFVFSIPEISGPDILSGPLYKYDANTGEHSALGIESNQYTPTPYGLAVWYNQFSIEPYDVERADLILHDYNGTPLYRLDAGVIELFGACFAADQTLAFHSYNWYPMILWNLGLSDTWDYEDENDEVFTFVPLDGSAKTGGVRAIPDPSSRFGPDEADGDGWVDAWDDWNEQEDWYDDDSWWFDDDDDSHGGPSVYPGMFEDGWQAFAATPNQRMATRTGPGTRYAEDHGTLPASTEIVACAQEETNGTIWVMIEFVRSGALVRAYTGLKRVDTNSTNLPKTTGKPREATVSQTTPAYYGPGSAYLAVPTPVAAGTNTLVYGLDRGHALIEYEIEPGLWTRSWVPADRIEIQ
ncbi:MAG: DUF5050 domain-containing protein [Clostridia bacterium]|nr:DUF5050 domain-containing protein [Clostridia bacterium]